MKKAPLQDNKENLSTPRSLLWAASLVWGIFVYVAYYNRIPYDLTILPKTFFNQTLFVIPSLSRMADFGSSILLAGAFCFMTFTLGSYFLRKFSISWNNSLEELAFSGALGFGALGYCVLFLGSLQLLYAKLLLVLLSLGFLFSLASLRNNKSRELWTGIYSNLKKIFFKNSVHSFLSFFLIYSWATGLIMGLLPETFYDSLVYHLAVPKRYLLENGLVSINNTHSNFPLLIQMNYLIGLVLKDETIPKLTHYAISWLTGIGMLSLGIRLKNQTIGLLSAVLFMTLPVLQLNIWTSGIDAGLCLFSFLAFYGFILIEKSPTMKMVALMALMSGFAISTKYTGGLIPVVLFIGFLFFYLKTEIHKPTLLKQQVLFIVITTLLFVPWLIKNAIFTGNPIYPFLNNEIGFLPIENWRYSILTKGNSGYTADSLFGFLSAPWALSIDIRSRFSFLGPVFLAFAGFFLFFRWRKASLVEKKLFFLTLAYFGIALWLTRLTRFLLPGFTLLSILLAFSLDPFIRSSNKWIKSGTILLISMSLFHQISWALIAIQKEFNPSDYLKGNQSRHEYLMQDQELMNPNSSLPMYRYIENNLSPESRVLIFGEEKTFNLNSRHESSGVYDTHLLVSLCNAIKSPEKISQQLIQKEFTHLMVNFNEVDRLSRYGILGWSPEGFETFKTFWKDYLQFQHVEYVKSKNDYKNTLVLLAISSSKLPSNRTHVDNLIADVYENSHKKILGRQGVEP